MKTSLMTLQKDFISSQFEKFDFKLFSMNYLSEDASCAAPNEYTSNFKLLIMLSGKGCINLSGNQHFIKQGDVVLVAPGTYYFPQIVGPDRCCFTNIIFNIVDENQLDIFKNLFSNKSLIIVPELITEFIESCIYNALDSVQNQLPGHYHSVKLLLSRILFLTVHYMHDNPKGVTTNTKNSASRDKLVTDCTNYIVQNLHKPIEVQHLCEIYNVSQSYLYNCFKETLDCSTKEFIVMQKLKHAAHELATTDKTLTDIACDCGFSNCYQFSNVFKKHYGMPPGKYRAAVLKDPDFNGMPLKIMQ